MSSNRTSIIQGIRIETVSSLRGTVLEIGAGNGENLPYLPKSISLIASEPDMHRCNRLLDRALAHGIDTTVLQSTCEHIALPDNSIDAVLSTFALCSVDDPAAALSEIKRVLRPGAAVHFMEHVAASPHTFVHAFQSFLAPLSRRFNHGCDPLAQTQELFIASGFTFKNFQRREFTGIPLITGLAITPNHA
jgi:ubiquinone/menaquinone biosynthesis C-methylase UbiE